MPDDDDDGALELDPQSERSPAHLLVPPLVARELDESDG
jgi:hypothetical protein